jgi:ABC-type sugar transport system ATPase subunit
MVKLGLVFWGRLKEPWPDHDPLWQNIVPPAFSVSLRRFVDTRKEREVVAKYIPICALPPCRPRLVSACPRHTTKSRVSKWLCTHSRIFIFDEPTRGIDVGAKAEIHGFMNELVKQGAAVLMISSDLPEILGMSDRIYVMRQGQVVAEVPRDKATQERIVAYAMGHEVEK